MATKEQLAAATAASVAARQNASTFNPLVALQEAKIDPASPIGRSAAKLLAQMPPIYRGGYLDALAGKSLRAAVNAHCLECVGWQREEVKRCTAYGCAMYGYRPYQD
jgi:hypothetical protein